MNVCMYPVSMRVGLDYMGLRYDMYDGCSFCLLACWEVGWGSMIKKEINE